MTEPCVLSDYVSVFLQNDRCSGDQLRGSLVVSIADTPHGCAILFEGCVKICLSESLKPEANYPMGATGYLDALSSDSEMTDITRIKGLATLHGDWHFVMLV